MNTALRLCAALAFAFPLSTFAEKILIGQSAPLTGSNAEIGKDIRDGALAYFKKVNDAGGVNGRTIELVSLDDKNDRKTAGANAVKLDMAEVRELDASLQAIRVSDDPHVQTVKDDGPIRG